MQTYFYELSDYIKSLLRNDEIFMCELGGEISDFIRFNTSRIRQPGNVKQYYLNLKLVNGRRHASEALTLSGEMDLDRAQLKAMVGRLRELLPQLPEDPHLLYATEVNSGERIGENELPTCDAALSAIMQAGSGKDLVGIYARGGIFEGFANSFDQRNWFETYTFNLDWCFYHQGDKAVKSGYAGFRWDGETFRRKLDSAEEQLGILSRPPHTIEPGKYRVYLSPGAVYDILELVAWGGFGLKDHRTKQTTLLKMVEEGRKLHPSVTIIENTKDGVAANFQSAGFIKPDSVMMIHEGEFRECLASPRSAKEYGVETNGANFWEAPESWDMAPGDLAHEDILNRLNTGVYINNVWYLNYSDRPACRLTGMTRFATFWVENGEIRAPLNVMRFDETIYRMLGENLRALTSERDFIMDPGSYFGRSTGSGRVPGALVDDFAFTL